MLSQLLQQQVMEIVTNVYCISILNSVTTYLSPESPQSS